MKERAELLFTGLYGRVFDVEAHEHGFTVRGAAPFIERERGGYPPFAVGYVHMTADITLYDGFAIVAAHSDSDHIVPPDRTGYKVSGLGNRTYLVLDEQEKWPAYVAYGDFLFVALRSDTLITSSALSTRWSVFSTRWVEDEKVSYEKIYHRDKLTVFTIGHSAVKLPDNYQELVFHPFKVS